VGCQKIHLASCWHFALFIDWHPNEPWPPFVEGQLRNINSTIRYFYPS
jgi:hypothetical protein